MWSADDLCALAGQALERAARALDDEQAVRGIDALDELALHPLLRAGFESAGLGALAEQPYPTPPRARSRHTERPRCDIVLTPRPGQILADAVDQERHIERAPLFEAHARRNDPGRLDPESAYWLEVKSTAQFAFVSGVPGPNRTYASNLGADLADLPKLARDPRILHAGMLLVLFVADRATAEHDARTLADRAASRGLLSRPPAIEHRTLTDRIGNAAMSLILLPAARGP